MRDPAFLETTQIGLVVRDIEATARRYEEDFGIGPWNFMDIGPEVAENYQEFGKPMTQLCRIAGAKIGSVWWELVQPLTDEGMAAKWLREKGEGVYHIAVRAADFHGLVAEQKEQGKELAMSGRFIGDVDVAYLDTQESLGVLIEIFSKMPGE
jgi:methylmalonyl-CoA/ethylmalonyl-CoA epimerase